MNDFIKIKSIKKYKLKIKINKNKGNKADKKFKYTFFKKISKYH